MREICLFLGVVGDFSGYRRSPAGDSRFLEITAGTASEIQRGMVGSEVPHRLAASWDALLWLLSLVRAEPLLKVHFLDTTREQMESSLPVAYAAVRDPFSLLLIDCEFSRAPDDLACLRNLAEWHPSWS